MDKVMLENEIFRLQTKMSDLEIGSEEYAAALNSLIRLQTVIENDRNNAIEESKVKNDKVRNCITGVGDAMSVIATARLGVKIFESEQFRAVTTKALDPLKTLVRKIGGR